jgi:hypothetical protein
LIRTGTAVRFRESTDVMLEDDRSKMIQRAMETDPWSLTSERTTGRTSSHLSKQADTGKEKAGQSNTAIMVTPREAVKSISSMQTERSAIGVLCFRKEGRPVRLVETGSPDPIKELSAQSGGSAIHPPSRDSPARRTLGYH